MSATLDFSHPPLALLSPTQQARFDRACDIAYFPTGQRVLEQGAASRSVYWVIKGHLRALRRDERGEEFLADYGPGDVLGAFAVILGAARFSYEVVEDTLCHAVDASEFQRALADNAAFAAWFQGGLAAKRQVVGQQREDSDLAETMLTRVADAQLAPALQLTASASLREAREAMKQAMVSCVLVAEDAPEPGILTRTDVLDALALEGAERNAAIRPWVRRPLVAISPREPLFMALVKMTEHHVERVVVRDGEQILGTLGMSEVLSHYSSHSHLIGLQLARAGSVAEIVAAARRVPALLRVLQAQGARMSYLMQLVSALNTRILGALYRLLVPTPLQARACLLVLGSEGRREQIMRSDQDNALLLEDGVDEAALVAPMQALSEALLACGWPPCAGGVMVNNPHWRGSAGQWEQRVAELARSSDPARLIDLAILLDARAVAGRGELFEPLRPRLWQAARNDIVLHHFAQAAVAFATPLTLFGRLRAEDRRLEIKKGGVFPLVHGLRALALKHQVMHRNSFDRAEALVAAGALDAELARDLQQALSVFMRLRLARQLDAEKAGEPIDNWLPLDALRHLDRELLRDALAVVDRFKRQLRLQFHL
jgi:CBS domain-containing protein